MKKNITGILGFEFRSKQKEDTLNDLEREANFLEEVIILISSLITFNFKQNTAEIAHWKSTGIDNYSLKTDFRGVANISSDYPKVSSGTRMSVRFSVN